VTLHVIALARVIAIALDPVRGLVAAVGAELAAGAAERAPHPLMARCAFCRQVTSLVRTDTKGLGTTVLGAIRVLARLQDPRLLAARHGGERMEGTEELQKWGRTFWDRRRPPNVPEAVFFVGLFSVFCSVAAFWTPKKRLLI